MSLKLKFQQQQIKNESIKAFLIDFQGLRNYDFDDKVPKFQVPKSEHSASDFRTLKTYSVDISGLVSILFFWVVQLLLKVIVKKSIK